MHELFAESTILFVAVVFAFCLIVGSFLNVVIYRLPIMMERDWREQCAELAQHADEREMPEGRFDLAAPRSRCPSCGTEIAAWQNIPVVSYLILGGKCGKCVVTIEAGADQLEPASSKEQNTIQKKSLKAFKTQCEKEYIESVLQRSHWNVAAAARILDIQRTYLHQKITSLGIRRPGSQSED